MSCFQRGATAWDTGLRRIVKIKSVSEEQYGHSYEVTAREEHGSHESESGCCDLRPLDDSNAGRANRKIVDEIEKLMAQLRQRYE